MTKRKKIILILLSPLMLVVSLVLSVFLYLFLHYGSFFTIPPEVVIREEAVPLPRTEEEDEWATLLHRQIGEKLGIKGEGLPALEISESWRRWERKDILEIRSDSLHLSVNRPTGEVVRFTDRTLPPEEERDATRTQEEVISLAESYIKKITGRARPKDYNALTVEYDRQDGEWVINYSRTVNGIRFTIGAYHFFFLQIDDLSGRLRAFARGASLERLPPLDVKITRERAIRIARGGIFLLFRAFYPELVYAELRMGSPNLSFTLSGFRAEGRASIGEVFPYEPRLVWIVAFHNPHTQIGRNTFYRWVDAQTGRIIGGDMGPIWYVERYKNTIYLD
jgi:hypothetical protein